MATKSEWAWVAGILEGEGCLHVPADGKRAGRIHVKMTDFDVIDRLAAITGVGRIRDGKSAAKDKPCRCWEVAYRNDILFVLGNTMKWFGIRRLKQALKLEAYARAKYDIRDPAARSAMCAKARASQEKPVCVQPSV